MNRQAGRRILKVCAGLCAHQQRALSCSSQLSQITKLSRQEEWLWPLTRNGVKYAELHRIGTMSALGSWSLETSKPIEPHYWIQAYRHVQRMCPVMQVKIRERNGQLWYCHDDHVDTQIKIQQPGLSATDEVTRASLSWFGMEEEFTSLCRFYIIPEAQDDPGYSSNRRSDTHPHRYTLLPVFHHGLCDGWSTIHVSSVFVKVLNQLLAGDIVDDSVINGDFLPCENFLQLKETPVSRDGLNLITEESNKEPVILKGFPPPGGQDPVTKFTFSTLEGDELFAIKDACKREGVAFHSALMAAHQIATMDLLHSAGVKQDTATFSVNMSTDLRRYMASNPVPIHGLHSARSTMLIRTKNSQDSSFWNFARFVEKEKSGLLNSKDALVQMLKAEKSHPSKDLSQDMFDYCITALRAIKTHPSHVVQVLAGTMYVFVHNTSFMSFLSYIISNHKYVITYSYASNLMEEKTAKMLTDKTLNNLKEHSRRSV